MSDVRRDTWAKGVAGVDFSPASTALSDLSVLSDLAISGDDLANSSGAPNEISGTSIFESDSIPSSDRSPPDLASVSDARVSASPLDESVNAMTAAAMSVNRRMTSTIPLDQCSHHDLACLALG